MVRRDYHDATIEIPFSFQRGEDLLNYGVGLPDTVVIIVCHFAVHRGPFGIVIMRPRHPHQIRTDRRVSGRLISYTDRMDRMEVKVEECGCVRMGRNSFEIPQHDAIVVGAIAIVGQSIREELGVVGGQGRETAVPLCKVAGHIEIRPVSRAVKRLRE
jgi:hypothetical protein